MIRLSLFILSCVVISAYGWSTPFYPVRALHSFRGPPRFNRPVRNIRPGHRPQPFRAPPVRELTSEEEPQTQWDRPKRDHYDLDGHDYDHDHDSHDRDHKETRGTTGPVHTFVKTDKNANYKWGVRHHVGNKFAS